MLALTEAGRARVQLYTHVDNPASQRAAEKAGFRREGVLRPLHAAERASKPQTR